MKDNKFLKARKISPNLWFLKPSPRYINENKKNIIDNCDSFWVGSVKMKKSEYIELSNQLKDKLKSEYDLYFYSLEEDVGILYFTITNEADFLYIVMILGCSYSYEDDEILHKNRGTINGRNYTITSS